jgi:adenylosuccinate synthase
VLANKGFIDEIEDINSRFPELDIKKRLVVSAYASVITDEDVAWEKENLPWQNTGSTQKGIGAALSRRALRSGAIVKDSIQRTLLEHGITVAGATKVLFVGIPDSGSGTGAF